LVREREEEGQEVRGEVDEDLARLVARGVPHRVEHFGRRPQARLDVAVPVSCLITRAEHALNLLDEVGPLVRELALDHFRERFADLFLDLGRVFDAVGREGGIERDEVGLEGLAVRRRDRDGGL
jgi:hypothetical protein